MSENKNNVFLVLLPKFINNFLGLFFDMSFAGLETTNYFEGLTHAVLDQSKAQIEVKYQNNVRCDCVQRACVNYQT